MSSGFNIQDLLQQAQQMQGQMQRIKSELSQQIFKTSAGGGVVQAEVRGDGTLMSIRIDPKVVDPSDVEMLQDLVLAAVNEGTRQSKELLKGELQKAAGGLPIPDLF